MSTTSSPVQEQKQWVENLLQKLNGLTKKLPTIVPCGSKDGPIAKHFSDYTYDTSEGPVFTFNQSWERVFQCVDSEKQYLVGTPLTAGCTKYKNETLKQPPCSNFITHSMIFKSIPVGEM